MIIYEEIKKNSAKIENDIEVQIWQNIINQEFYISKEY